MENFAQSLGSIFRHVANLDNWEQEGVTIPAWLNVATDNSVPRSGSSRDRVVSQSSSVVEDASPLFSSKVVASEKSVKMEFTNVVFQIMNLALKIILIRCVTIFS